MPVSRPCEARRIRYTYFAHGHSCAMAPANLVRQRRASQTRGMHGLGADRHKKASVMVTIAAGSVALTGCSSEPAAVPEQPERRPSQARCDQAQASLEAEGRSRSSGFLFEQHGEAMIDRERWMRMNESDRERLIDSLAVLASCNSATPQREVEVTIVAESGAVLTRRIVSPSVTLRR